MNTYKIIGIEYGEFEGCKWAHAFILQKIYTDRGVGWKIVLDRDKKPSIRMVYDLAMKICADWDVYENQEINIMCDPFGRIVGIDLAD